MTELEVLIELYRDLDRLAPGSEASTLRALEAVRRHVAPARILDIGCGTGSQTFVLARHTDAAITAVDTSEEFLARLRKRAAGLGVSDRVTTHAASMSELAFAAGSFDAIWSEGSAYVMGFDAALASWGRMLAPGGVLAISELTWLTDDRSPDAVAYWNANYPAARNTAANIAAAERAGFQCVEHFALPATDWTHEYYGPLSDRLAEISGRLAGDETAQAVFTATREEIDFYFDYGHEYGYVFYVLTLR